MRNMEWLVYLDVKYGKRLLVQNVTLFSGGDLQMYSY